MYACTVCNDILARLGEKFQVATMNDADQTIQNWFSSSTWEPLAKYSILVGGPGTIYQDCGAFDDVLTLDNGKFLPGPFRNTVLDLPQSMLRFKWFKFYRQTHVFDHFDDSRQWLSG